MVIAPRIDTWQGSPTNLALDEHDGIARVDVPSGARGLRSSAEQPTGTLDSSASAHDTRDRATCEPQKSTEERRRDSKFEDREPCGPWVRIEPEGESCDRTYES